MKKKAIFKFLIVMLFVSLTLLLASCFESTYTVTFDSDGGSTVESVKLNSGDLITEPVTSKAGYTFAGWYVNSDKWDFEHYVVSKNITLTAKWLKNYTVTFDSDGGSAISNRIAPSGTLLEAPQEPIKESSEFLGWYSGDLKWNFNENTVESNLTLTAKWRKIHKVSFDSNGGDAVLQQFVKDGDPAVLPNEPSRYGYCFDGWYSENTAWDFNTPINSDITLLAKWSPLYTVSFSTDGAEKIDAQMISSGSLVTCPDEIAKNGYVFDGWYAGDLKWNFETDIVTSDVILTAKWIKKHTVVFNTNGGSPVSQTYVLDKQKLTAPKTEREFFNFAGWSFNGEIWDFETDIVEEDITLTAIWEINYWIISFDTDGGNEIAPFIIKRGEKIPKPTTPAKDHSAFSAWYFNDEKWDFDEAPSGNMQLIAKWDLNYYTVNYDTNGANETLEAQKIPAYGYASFLNVTKDGYKLVGWTYNGTDWDFENNAVSYDITLVAKWAKLYTVKFDLSGGSIGDSSSLSSQSVAEAYKVTEPEEPTKLHFKFLGWYADGVMWDFENDTVTESITLVARWEECYSVKFNTNGGEGHYLDQQRSKDELVSMPAIAPTRTGYNFAGWYLGEILWDFETMKPTQDIVLVAKWEIKMLTVTFDSNGANEIPPQTVPYGGKITIPTTPYISEFMEFNGWRTPDRQKWNFDTDIVTSDITLKAFWIRYGFGAPGGVVGPPDTFN